VTENDEKLLQLSMAATFGPWRSAWDDPLTDKSDPYEDPTVYSTAEGLKDEDRGVIVKAYYDGNLVGANRENAAYIAALSPDVLQDLLRRFTKAETDLARTIVQRDTALAQYPEHADLLVENAKLREQIDRFLASAPLMLRGEL
jgi:hypothetical protein